VQSLRECTIVDGLSQEEIAAIAAQCTFHRVDAHQNLFEEGDESEGLWILLEGRFRIHHEMADGRQQVVGFRAPTAALELSSALDGRPNMATATALEPAVVMLVPRPALRALSQNYPATVRNVINLLCLEVRQRDIVNAIGSLKDARGRVACSLLQLARQFGKRNGDATTIAYRLTRQDIADRSGMTIETAIRVLSEFQQQDIIRTRAQIIEILDKERLQDLPRCAQCQFDCSVFSGPGIRPVD
jgi:CRP-like cAMP-binding protein